MNNLLQKSLLKKHPFLFAEFHNPKKDSSPMADRGIECGDGWYFLIDHMATSIQSKIDKAKASGLVRVDQLIFIQIKEKFGKLTVYSKGRDDYLRPIIHYTEELSYITCENCGQMNETVGHTKEGWIQTLCEKCAKEYQRNISQSKTQLTLWERVRKSRHNVNRSWDTLNDWMTNQ